MPKLNENYRKLKDSYLFAEIAHRTAAYMEKHPDQSLIRLGIGDVTRPLCHCAVQALHEGADEMGRAETFKVYGPEQGIVRCSPFSIGYEASTPNNSTSFPSESIPTATLFSPYTNASTNGPGFKGAISAP